jgi:saccharopine dehydrogenase-like NADP-dependent oxidoreductase
MNMKTILVIGAGRSSSSLIDYLLKQSEVHEWKIIVGDASIEAARSKINLHKNGTPIAFDIQQNESHAIIGEADLVISLLPPPFHPIVAVQCLKYSKHLLTASYVSDEMKAFDKEAREKHLIFLNECGLDPGIDHMSAMQVIDKIRSNGGTLLSFHSFTGGLIAADTDPENPWRYKFTWNPRNVVMAGQGTAKFLHEGKFKYIPYQQLFKRTTQVRVEGGDYEGYANRDSLKYIETYGLQGIKSMLRGTLRNKGFCAAWNVLVQLGCCDDTYEMDAVEAMSHADFLNSFLPENNSNIKQKLKEIPGLINSNEIDFLDWSGFFDDTPVGLNRGTPAQILEHILNKKWKLNESDKDQIVMWHRFVYEHEKKTKEIQSSLVATGSDSVYTAMAKTVGLPLAIAAKLILLGKIKSRGVVIPIDKEIYNPVLEELKTVGIVFHETES